jgi:hypothetical protein
MSSCCKNFAQEATQNMLEHSLCLMQIPAKHDEYPLRPKTVFLQTADRFRFQICLISMASFCETLLCLLIQIAEAHEIKLECS